MKKRTVQQINKEIAEKKEQLKTVKGTETEIYTRIVGYYRSIKAFNKGQAAQLRRRVNYKIEEL